MFEIRHMIQICHALWSAMQNISCVKYDNLKSLESLSEGAFLNGTSLGPFQEKYVGILRIIL